MGGPTDEFLAHYGIPGMKWGRRRNRSGGSSSSSTPASEHHVPSADYLHAKTYGTQAKTHGTATLSNKQMQDVITRMNLEKQYTQLNPSQVSAGKKLSNSLLKTAGQVGQDMVREQVKTGLKAAVKYGVKYAMEKGLK